MAWKLDGQPCVDPASLLRTCRDAGIPFDFWYRKANLFRIPTGISTPGTGAVLMRRFDYNLIDTSATITLEIDSGSGPIQLKYLSIVGVENALPGASGDSNTVLLVRLADQRIELKTILNKAYNIRNAAGTGWETSSLNGGAPWTWQEIVTNIWSTFVSLGGSSSLPFTPHGTPENFAYWQVPSAVALDDILNRLGCAILYRPDTGVYSIVRLGTGGTKATGEANLANKKNWQSEALNVNRITYPQTIRVLFRKAREVLTDPSVDPFYTNEVAVSPAPAGVIPSSYITLIDDMTGLASNGVTRIARAAERAADWLRIADFHNPPYLYSYAGFRSDGWHFIGPMGRELAFVDVGAGEKTEVRSGTFPPWTWPFPASAGGGSGEGGDWEQLCLVSDAAIQCLAGTVTLSITKICRRFHTQASEGTELVFSNPENSQLFPVV